jgi:hypothetical protein
LHTVSQGKRKFNMRQGFTYCKDFENGNAWPYFSLFFPWRLQGIKGKKGNLIWCRVLLSVKVLKKGMPQLIFLFSFLDTCLGKKCDAGLPNWRAKISAPITFLFTQNALITF